MPLRDFTCKECGLLQERYYQVVNGVPNVPSCAVEECHGHLEMAPLSIGTSRKTAVFPFTSTNIDGNGTPIVVEDIGHLRRLENQYGVLFTGFSNHDSNLETPRDLPQHRPGGRAYEGPRMPWMER